MNDLDEPFYDLKEYKPKCIIPDEDIIVEEMKILLKTPLQVILLLIYLINLIVFYNDLLNNNNLLKVLMHVFLKSR